VEKWFLGQSKSVTFVFFKTDLFFIFMPTFEKDGQYISVGGIFRGE
jgi:hypothetical protein